MKFAKIAVIFVVVFIAGQTMAGNRRTTFDQLAKGIKSVTDVDPYLVISKSDIIHDVEDFFGSPIIAERFRQVLQNPEDQRSKNLISDILYLVYGKSSGETITKKGQSVAAKFGTIVKNWKAVNDTCKAEGCSQDVFNLVSISGPDNWKPIDPNAVGPDNWKPIDPNALVGPDNWKPIDPNAVIGPDNWQSSPDGDSDPTPAPRQK